MSVRLKQALHNILSVEELGLLVGSYDVIGDLAVIIIPPELQVREREIGEALLANNKKIKVVLKREGNYQGEFRTIPLEVIAGEQRKETEHREYGVRLRVNPEEVYYSVRSSTERFRIASQVRDGERILVMFSGIGPYPLVIARNSGAGAIIGVEKNPVAHKYAMINCRLNSWAKNVRLIQGDVNEVLKGEQKRFDRIIMPLPKGGSQFLPLALSLLKIGGMLHYYDMRHTDEFEMVPLEVEAACSEINRQLRSASVVKCGHCAPRTHRICADCRIG